MMDNTILYVILVVAAIALLTGCAHTLEECDHGVGCRNRITINVPDAGQTGGEIHRDRRLLVANIDYSDCSTGICEDYQVISA